MSCSWQGEAIFTGVQCLLAKSSSFNPPWKPECIQVVHETHRNISKYIEIYRNRNLRHLHRNGACTLNLTLLQHDDGFPGRLALQVPLHRMGKANRLGAACHTSRDDNQRCCMLLHVAASHVWKNPMMPRVIWVMKYPTECHKVVFCLPLCLCPLVVAHMFTHATSLENDLTKNWFHGPKQCAAHWFPKFAAANRTLKWCFPMFPPENKCRNDVPSHRQKRIHQIKLDILIKCNDLQNPGGSLARISHSCCAKSLSSAAGRAWPSLWRGLATWRTAWIHDLWWLIDGLFPSI